MVVLFWLFGRYSGFGELNRCGGSVVCLFWCFSFSSYCLWFGNLIVSLGFVLFFGGASGCPVFVGIVQFSHIHSMSACTFS